MKTLYFCWVIFSFVHHLLHVFTHDSYLPAHRRVRCGGNVFWGMQSIYCLLTAILQDATSSYLVGEFQWNLAQIFIMWMGIAERFSLSEVVTILSAAVAEACILTVWHRCLLVFVCLKINRIYWSKMCFIGRCLPYHWRLSSSPTTPRGSVIYCLCIYFISRELCNVNK